MGLMLDESGHKSLTGVGTSKEEGYVTFRYLTALDLGKLPGKKRDPGTESGVITLAIRVTSNEIRVGAAYCNLSDVVNNKFSKRIGRRIALNRLESEQHVITTPITFKTNHANIGLAAMEAVYNKKLPYPRWVENILQRKLGILPW